MDNKELDDILASIKERQEAVAKSGTDTAEQPALEPLAPPQPHLTEERPVDTMPDPPMVHGTATPPDIPQEIVPPDNDDNDDNDGQDKGSLRKDVRHILAANARIIGIITAAIVIIAMAAAWGINYSRTAYLRPYEKKYGIDYPHGIMEDMCDQYGKNQHTVGSIDIPDISTSGYVTGRVQDGYSHLERGSSIVREQQFNAIRLTDDYAGIESVYSTAAGYKKASQQITFTTLYEKRTYQVIAAFYTNIDPADDNGYCFGYNLAGTLTDESYVQYRDRIQSRTLYDTGDTLPYNNSYLTLSVDSSVMDNYRFVLLCKRVDPPVKKHTAPIPNDKVHYPQNYYDTHNMTNPYRFASKWYPTIYTDKKHRSTTVLKDE